MSVDLGVPLEDAALRRFLDDVPVVDVATVTASVAAATQGSGTGERRARAVDLAVSLIDLTTLEGTDTPERVAALGARARRPAPDDPSCPPVAAVCVYPDLVEAAVTAVAGSGVEVASVAGAFPSGRSSLAVRLADTQDALDAGAGEIDMVIDRGAFLGGRLAKVAADIAATAQICREGPRPARLKVILETGELGSLDNVRRASWLAIAAGADFIKTSTGKTTPAATEDATLVMAQVVREVWERTGSRVGLKAAGGIRTTDSALRYLDLVEHTLGTRWLTPRLFRLGASSLLDDLLAARRD